MLHCMHKSAHIAFCTVLALFYMYVLWTIFEHRVRVGASKVNLNALAILLLTFLRKWF